MRSTAPLQMEPNKKLFTQINSQIAATWVITLKKSIGLSYGKLLSFTEVKKTPTKQKPELISALVFQIADIEWKEWYLWSGSDWQDC